MNVADLVRSHDAGPHRRVSVQALAQIPLLMSALHVSGAHIIDDGVTHDIGKRLFFADAERVSAQDHPQLHLVVQTVHEVIHRYPSARIVRPVHSFAKIYRVLFFRKIQPLCHIAHMGLVVHAKADHILHRHGNRGEDPICTGLAYGFFRGTA